MSNSVKESNKTPYFVNLDILRFLAAMAVLFFHYQAFLKGLFPENKLIDFVSPLLNRGHLGVNLFFVLSSFLITYLVFREIQKTGTFSIKYFLIRRTLRIWPLYFFVVFVSFLVVYTFPIYGETSHKPGFFLVFLSNFSELFFGDRDQYTQLTIPWSVSIEEQFYLFWAVIIGGFAILKKQHFLSIFSVLLVGSVLFQFFNYEDERTLYYHTFSAVTDFTIGAIGAWLFYFHKNYLKPIINPKKLILYSIYLLVFCVILFKNKLFHYGELIAFERLIIAVCMAWIILRTTSDNFKFPKKIKKLAIHLGKISYGIYMYHALFLFFTEVINVRYTISSPLLSLLLFISLVLTLLFSHLSYQYFERKFLKLKKNYRVI